MSLRGELSTELTPREREVAELIQQGKSNPEIAAALNIARGTVCEYVARIFERQGVTKRADVKA